MNPLKHLRRNLIAYVALFCALTAGAYAAGLKKNSVGSKQIKSAAVKTDEIADGAVTGAKVDEGTLAEVPNAAHAKNADHAQDAVTAQSASKAQDAVNATNAVNAQSAVSAQDANTVGGAAVKTFSASQVSSTPLAQVVAIGDLSVSLECDAGGDTEVSVRTSRDNGSIEATAEYSTASTTRVVTNDDDFDTGEVALVVPHAAQAGNIVGELRYLAQNGHVVTVNFATDSSAAGDCQVWGTAIGN